MNKISALFLATAACLLFAKVPSVQADTCNIFAVQQQSSAAFMIDRSGSMDMPAAAGSSLSRYDVVTKAFVDFLENQQPGFMFSVHTFDSDVNAPWMNGELMANTGENQLNLRSWFASRSPAGGGTNILAAITALVGLADVEQRFLLADGDASYHDKILAQAENAGHAVNTIGIGLLPGRSGYQLLSNIADESGGSKNFITSLESCGDTTTTTTTSTSTSTSTTTTTYAPVWSQCGGEGHATQSCEAGSQCFKQHQWYSQCRPSCPSDWECNITPAPTTPTPTCADPAPAWSQCGGEGHATPCCEAGSQCFRQDQWYSQCRPSCPSDWECNARRNLRGRAGRRT